MLDQPTLLSRLGLMDKLKVEVLNDSDGQALIGEFLERYEQAHDALENIGQRQSPDYSALMFAAFCLNRCEAIVETIRAPGIRSGTIGLVASTDILNCTRDKILTRWFLARGTWLRAKLLNYSSYYQTPPLKESITILFVQRLDRNSRLFRILKKIQSRT